MNKIFFKIDNDLDLTRDDIKSLLQIEGDENLKHLFNKAYEIKKKNVGTKAFYRGIIEFSNICDKDCYYCGVRKSNDKSERFMLTREEVLEAAEFAYKSNYGSLVLQAGERSDAHFIDFVEDIIKGIKSISDNKLGITISLGEETKETYARWFDAGAHRYLLRIETTNPELYGTLHPESHKFLERKKCLQYLREIGYQVGTGVMIGLPGQTIDDLADDIIFFKENDVDMIGMGPYLTYKGSPLDKKYPDFVIDDDKQLNLALKMVAVARIVLKDVNIAATTALQAIHPKGREKGLLAGANVIMPNLTETKYRPNYQLYDNKPCIDENSSMCTACLKRRIEGSGEEVGLGEWGDSPHFIRRTQK